jgi:hypothetical protein
MNGDGCPGIGAAHPFWFEEMFVYPKGLVAQVASE